MARTKDETVRELANWHFGVEPGLTQVIVIVGEKDDEPGEPIKLLEINAATVATGSVEPFAFAPTSSVPFPTLIAEVTPEEFAQIESQTLPLPAGWSLARAKHIKRPDAA